MFQYFTALVGAAWVATNNGMFASFFNLIALLFRWVTTGPVFFVNALDDANLAGTYANGTAGVGATLTKASAGAFPTIDGVAVALGQTVLLTAQTSAFQNGFYTLTNAGSSTVAWVLTRSPASGNQPAWNSSATIIYGSAFYVMAGTAYGGQVWAYTGPNTPTVGTTALTFAVDGIARTALTGGTNSYAPVDLVSASNITGTYSAGVFTVTATGALTVDSVVATLGMRILLQTQTTTTQQGIYVLTADGSGSTHPKLTRASDQESSAQFISGWTVAAKSGGTTYQNTLWELSFTPPFTLDTSTPAFTQTSTAVTLGGINTALATGHAVFPHAGWPEINNAGDTAATTVGSLATVARATNLPDLAGTIAITGEATGTPSATSAPAFTGTTPIGAVNYATPAFSGTGGAAVGQVFTTTDTQTMPATTTCAGMIFCTATQGPFIIASNTIVAGAPAVLTFYGAAPITDAGTYKIFRALAPVGTVAAVPSNTHTHTNG